MSSTVEYANRQVIPRWTPYKVYNRLSNQTIDRVEPNPEEIRAFTNARFDWERSRSVSSAIEFVAAAVVTGQVDDSGLTPAIQLIRKTNSEQINPLTDELLRLLASDSREICSSNINQPGQRDLFRSVDGIRFARRSLFHYPHDSLTWMDLGYYYTINGFTNKAKRCVEIALGLNSQNDFLLRSAARFFVHIEDPERSISILRQPGLSKIHPTILSSEIAICEAFGLKSTNIKRGRQIVHDDNFRLIQRTELAASLSTIDFNSGNKKKARSYLKLALDKPSENTLAQAEFLGERYNFDFDLKQFDVPCSYEANTWQNFSTQKFAEARETAESWFLFQPFSSRPALVSSYLSAVHLDDDQGALRILETALEISPEDEDLKNNQAFSLARIGRISEARNILSTIDLSTLDERTKAVIKATNGLMEIRSRNTEQGVELYREAIKFFRNEGDNRGLARARFFFAKEAFSFDRLLAIQELKAAVETAKKYHVKEVLHLASRLQEMESIKAIETKNQ